MEEEKRQLRELNQRIIDNQELSPLQEQVRQDLTRLFLMFALDLFIIVIIFKEEIAKEFKNIKEEIAKEFKEIKEEIIVKRQSRLQTHVSTHDTPVSAGGAQNGGVRLTDIPLIAYTEYDDQYNLKPEKDASYYIDKLHPHFESMNGDKRFRLIKSRSSILIKDGKKMVFRCLLTPVNARNLYLEMHSCGYDCESWLVASKLESFRSTFEYSKNTTPPDL
eukprot:gene14042-18833_t